MESELRREAQFQRAAGGRDGDKRVYKVLRDAEGALQVIAAALGALPRLRGLDHLGADLNDIRDQRRKEKLAYKEAQRQRSERKS